MRNLLIIIFFLPILAWGQQRSMEIYTNDFKDLIDKNQTLICGELTDLGVRLIKTEAVMKYDYAEISLRYYFNDNG